MRILMLVPQAFYSTRGTPLSAYHRSRDLAELGHHVDVLTYPVGAPPPSFEGKVYRATGPYFASRIAAGPSYRKIWFDVLMLPNLVWRLLRGRYELIYAHEEGAFMATLVAPVFRIPVVYDMHSSLPFQIREWGFSKSERVIDLFRRVERFTLRRARTVVAISPGVADAARRALPGLDVITILNRFTIDAPTSAEDGERLRRQLGLTRRHRVVLYTGSFVALQALDRLVRAIPLVVARVPEAKFVLVGGTEAEIRDLSRLAREVGAEPHLILLPARPQSEMPAFMAACDALVSPRERGINPPGKLFSYLSSGRPVVATDCLVHNQILNRRCAILTAPDPAGLADGIVSALVDEERRRKIVEGAREILSTEYGAAQRAAAYGRLLESLEDRRSNRVPSTREGRSSESPA